MSKSYFSIKNDTDNDSHTHYIRAGALFFNFLLQNWHFTQSSAGFYNVFLFQLHFLGCNDLLLGFEVS